MGRRFSQTANGEAHGAANSSRGGDCAPQVVQGSRVGQSARQGRDTNGGAAAASSGGGIDVGLLTTWCMMQWCRRYTPPGTPYRLQTRLGIKAFRSGYSAAQGTKKNSAQQQHTRLASNPGAAVSQEVSAYPF